MKKTQNVQFEWNKCKIFSDVPECLISLNKSNIDLLNDTIFCINRLINCQFVIDKDKRFSGNSYNDAYWHQFLMFLRPFVPDNRDDYLIRILNIISLKTSCRPCLPENEDIIMTHHRAEKERILSLFSGERGIIIGLIKKSVWRDNFEFGMDYFRKRSNCMGYFMRTVSDDAIDSDYKIFTPLNMLKEYIYGTLYHREPSKLAMMKAIGVTDNDKEADQFFGMYIEHICAALSRLSIICNNVLSNLNKDIEFIDLNITNPLSKKKLGVKRPVPLMDGLINAYYEIDGLGEKIEFKESAFFSHHVRTEFYWDHGTDIIINSKEVSTGFEIRLNGVYDNFILEMPINNFDMVLSYDCGVVVHLEECRWNCSSFLGSKGICILSSKAHFAVVDQDAVDAKIEKQSKNPVKMSGTIMVNPYDYINRKPLGYVISGSTLTVNEITP